MTHWTRAAFALAFALAAPACGGDPLGTLTASVAPALSADTKSCVPPAGAAARCDSVMGTNFIYSGTYDVGIAVATGADYVLRPVLVDHPATSLTVVGVDIELVPDAKSALASGIPPAALKRSIALGGPYLSPTCATYQLDPVPVIDHEVARAIRDSGVLNAGAGSVFDAPDVLTVRLRYRYKDSGNEGSGSWLEFPVKVCLWCLANADQISGTTQSTEPGICKHNGIMYGDPCTNGRAQDSPTVCCRDGSRILCGLDVPL